MKKRTLLLSLLAGVIALLAGCAATNSSAKGSSAAFTAVSHSNTETVYSAERRQESMWFVVKTTGCTSEKHFELSVAEQSRGAHTVLVVTLIRHTPDRCKAMPGYTGVELSHPLLQQRNVPVLVTNGFGVKIKPVHKRQK